MNILKNRKAIISAALGVIIVILAFAIIYKVVEINKKNPSNKIQIVRCEIQNYNELTPGVNDPGSDIVSSSDVSLDIGVLKKGDGETKVENIITIWAKNSVSEEYSEEYYPAEYFMLSGDNLPDNVRKYFVLENKKIIPENNYLSQKLDDKIIAVRYNITEDNFTSNSVSDFSYKIGLSARAPVLDKSVVFVSVKSKYLSDPKTDKWDDCFDYQFDFSAYQSYSESTGFQIKDNDISDISNIENKKPISNDTSINTDSFVSEQSPSLSDETSIITTSIDTITQTAPVQTVPSQTTTAAVTTVISSAITVPVETTFPAQTTTQIAQKEIQSFSVNFPSYAIECGSTDTVEVIINPTDAVNKNIFFTSSNPEIATVSGNTISTFSPGQTTITATTTNGLSLTFNIIVSPKTETETEITTYVEETYSETEMTVVGEPEYNPYY